MPSPPRMNTVNLRNWMPILATSGLACVLLAAGLTVLAENPSAFFQNSALNDGSSYNP